MNPRRRRNIARAIAAGMDPSHINNQAITKFLIEECGSLAISANEVDEFLYEEGVNNTINEDDDSTSVIENNNNSTTGDVTRVPNALKTRLTLKNTKAELLAAAKNNGLKVKSSMKKGEILNLLNENTAV